MLAVMMLHALLSMQANLPCTAFMRDIFPKETHLSRSGLLSQVLMRRDLHILARTSVGLSRCCVLQPWT